MSTITAESIHNLGMNPYGTPDQLRRFSDEVLAVANDPEYQQLVRAFLAITDEQVGQKADALTALSDYAYSFGMPEGKRRDSIIVTATFNAFIETLSS